MLAYTYIKKSNLRFLGSLDSQLQVINHPAPIDTPIDTRGVSLYTYSPISGLQGEDKVGVAVVVKSLD
jgi:hypothetical protein